MAKPAAATSAWKADLAVSMKVPIYPMTVGIHTFGSKYYQRQTVQQHRARHQNHRFCESGMLSSDAHMAPPRRARRSSHGPASRRRGIVELDDEREDEHVLQEVVVALTQTPEERDEI